MKNGKANDAREVRDAKSEVRIERPDEWVIRWSSMSMLFVDNGRNDVEESRDRVRCRRSEKGASGWGRR